MRPQLFGTVLCMMGALCVTAGPGHDPSPTWLSYAKASCPQGQRITSFTAQWVVPPKPKSHRAQENGFFCPWVGIETTDNRNLLQSVNGFFVGQHENNGEWHQNGEAYQWPDYNNTNSKMKRTASGHIFKAAMTMDAEGGHRSNPAHYKQSYTITSKDATYDAGTTLNIDVPHNGYNDTEPGFKNYTIAYVVFEHGNNRCSDYPTSEKMTFNELKVECNGQETPMVWNTSYVQDHCQFRTHVVDNQTVSMTWNTTMKK